MRRNRTSMSSRRISRLRNRRPLCLALENLISVGGRLLTRLWDSGHGPHHLFVLEVIGIVWEGNSMVVYGWWLILRNIGEARWFLAQGQVCVIQFISSVEVGVESLWDFADTDWAHWVVENVIRTAFVFTLLNVVWSAIKIPSEGGGYRFFHAVWIIVDFIPLSVWYIGVNWCIPQVESSSLSLPGCWRAQVIAWPCWVYTMMLRLWLLFWHSWRSIPQRNFLFLNDLNVFRFPPVLGTLTCLEWFKLGHAWTILSIILWLNLFFDHAGLMPLELTDRHWHLRVFIPTVLPARCLNVNPFFQ